MRAKTKAEEILWKRLANEVGCIACRITREEAGSPVSIHHIDGRTKPGCHTNVLPLCGIHHQTGKEGQAVHRNKTRWIENFGTEEELRQRCVRILEGF